jgi:hypothetical protein
MYILYIHVCVYSFQCFCFCQCQMLRIDSSLLFPVICTVVFVMLLSDATNHDVPVGCEMNKHDFKIPILAVAH